jgi:hypothetical protein
MLVAQRAHAIGRLEEPMHHAGTELRTELLGGLLDQLHRLSPDLIEHATQIVDGDRNRRTRH